MRLLVTGATGFLGAHFLKRLVWKKAEAALLLRPESSRRRIEPLPANVEVIEGDLRRLSESAAAIGAFQPECVVHLAWSGVGNRYRNDLSQLDDNLGSSLELLRLAHRYGCRKWVGLGSQAEYGPQNRRLDEKAPTEPTTLYGTTKLAACLLSRKLCELLEMDFAWVRVFSTYGPLEESHWMLPYVIETLQRGEQPALTAGEQRWDYLYAADAAEALWRVATTPRATGIFNLGSGTALPLRDVIRQIRDLIDPNLALGFGQVPYRADQVMHLEADITRLREATGWEPRTSLEEGLRRTIQWHGQRAGTEVQV